jgi:hypothetical protein
MPGLDPGIHLGNKEFSKRMDHRVKPGDDSLHCRRQVIFTV